jgi:hypothetical protein
MALPKNAYIKQKLNRGQLNSSTKAKWAEGWKQVPRKATQANMA